MTKFQKHLIEAALEWRSARWARASAPQEELALAKAVDEFLASGGSEWIDVENESVPEDRTVLTYRGNAWPPYMKIGADGTGGGTYQEYWVTHWTELPDRPKT